MEQPQGWICNECDVMNLNTEVCANCGYLQNYFRHHLNLYKIGGVWRTCKEWRLKLSISDACVYDRAEDKISKKL